MEVTKLNSLLYYIIKEKPKDKTERYLRLYKIDNCTLAGKNDYYPNVLILDDNNLIDPYNEKVMSLGKTSFYDEVFAPNIFLKSDDVEDPVYFFIYNTDNYFHFIYDTLPYLYYYLQLKDKMPNLKLLVNYPGEHKKELYKFVRESLELFGITTRDMIFHKEGMTYNEVYVSSSLTFEGYPNNPPRDEFYKVLNVMVKNAKNNLAIYSEKIYVSRRTWIHNKLDNIGTNYTQRRKMINEDTLVKGLIERGFVEVFTENMTMIEKINMFINAKYVIGAIGGGLCNLLFSSKETKCLCIVTPCFLEINERFKFSMETSDITYFNDTHLHKLLNQNITDYVRVRIIDKTSIYYNQIGEIEKYENDEYTVNISKNGVAGWNSLADFMSIQFNESQLEPLDGGLNSPYYVDLNLFNSSID